MIDVMSRRKRKESNNDQLTLIAMESEKYISSIVGEYIQVKYYKSLY